MWKRVVMVLAVAIVATSLVAGSDPWKEKPYKQWDAKDVEKILNDSPWVRQVVVSATWKPASGSAITQTTGGRNTGAAGGSISGSSQDSGQSSSDAAFRVVWASSLTIRQAVARRAVLRGTPEAKADEFLSQQPDTYVITVQGSDMTPFMKMDEMTLKQKTYLMLKKNKQKLTPDRVEIRRQGNSQRIDDVQFYFARKSASGEAVIASDEKQLEFSCDLTVTKLKTNFDLPKMEAGKGVDL